MGLARPDYPDAENFLFLLYGPNAKSKTGGSEKTRRIIKIRNTTSSSARMRYMDEGPAKAEAINELIKIVQEDAPLDIRILSDKFGGFPSVGA